MKFTREEKAKWLESWRLSGKRAWAYAKENGLCPQTFLKWTKVKEENESCFVEVPTRVLSTPVHDASEILIEKGEVKIHVPLALGSGCLRTVLESLGAAK